MHEGFLGGHTCVGTLGGVGVIRTKGADNMELLPVLQEWHVHACTCRYNIRI